MVKQKGFTQEDLEAKGFIKNEQGFYSKPSFPIKTDADTEHRKKVRSAAKPLKHEVPGSNYRGKKLRTSYKGVGLKGGTTIYIKPLSVNQAWQGKRFKTNKYKIYEREVLSLLPSERNFVMPQSPYCINLIFGVSSMLADFDNPTKLFVDLMQKKYGFNDRDIMKAIIEKQLVNKGEEFISFKITNHNS